MSNSCGKFGCTKAKITKASKALLCEICELWWHISCAEVTEDQYVVLNDGISGIHWFCWYCNVGSAKVLKALGEVKKELAECQKAVVDLKKQVVQARFNHDRLEQHGRKGSVRITGIPDPHKIDEDTNGKVVKIAVDSGLDLKTEDISVSHRLGKKDAAYDRAVIVKFVRREAKRSLMMMKKALKDKDGYQNIYINEDLTSIRYKISKQLRDDKKIAWTRDGKIFWKETKESTTIKVVDTYEDLCKLNWDDKKLSDIGLLQ